MRPAGAGDGRAPRPAPLLAFVELRARLLLRRFRARGGIPDLVARIALFAVAIPAGLLFAVGAGTGAVQALRSSAPGRDAILSVQLTGVWLTWTAVSLSVSERESLDLRRFLGYPLPPSRLYGYGLVASVVGDPFAVFWCLMLGGAFAGAALVRPGAWVALLALAYLLFVAATAAHVALLQELLARLLRGRRVREVAIAAVYVGLGFFLVFMSGGPRATLQAIRALGHVKWLAFPVPLAVRAISRLYGGEWLAAVGALAVLALAGLATAWAAYRLALSAALAGEDQAPRAAATGAGGWRVPGRLGPLLEKEGKYVLRHPISSVLALVVPAAAAFVAWKLVPRIPEEAGEVVRALPLFGFALYAHLATQPFWLNAFGWERGGGRAWFLAPVAPADVLVAKNVASYAFSLALFAGSAAAATGIAGAPPGWAIAGALTLHAGIAPWFLVAGNAVSILSPRAAPFNVQRGGHLTPVTAFAGMAIFYAGGALFAVPVLVALELEEPWLLVAGWAALGLAGAAAYRAALPRLARLVRDRREALLEAVCGDEA